MNGPQKCTISFGGQTFEGVMTIHDLTKSKFVNEFAEIFTNCRPNPEPINPDEISFSE